MIVTSFPSLLFNPGDMRVKARVGLRYKLAIKALFAAA